MAGITVYGIILLVALFVAGQMLGFCLVFGLDLLEGVGRSASHFFVWLVPAAVLAVPFGIEGISIAALLCASSFILSLPGFLLFRWSTAAMLGKGQSPAATPAFQFSTRGLFTLTLFVAAILAVARQLQIPAFVVIGITSLFLAAPLTCWTALSCFPTRSVQGSLLLASLLAAHLGIGFAIGGWHWTLVFTLILLGLLVHFLVLRGHGYRLLPGRVEETPACR